MNEFFWNLTININHCTSGKCRLFIDDNEFCLLGNVFTCKLSSLCEHKVTICQDIKQNIFSLDNVSIYEKESFKPNKSVFTINNVIVASIWTATFRIKKDAEVNIEFFKHYYTNYCGMSECFYLGKVVAHNGVKFLTEHSDINWSHKEKKHRYVLIQIKNTLLFFILAFCLSIQIYEGFVIGNNYIVAAYTGFQFMVFSTVLLTFLIVAYAYYSYRLYGEYKAKSIGGRYYD